MNILENINEIVDNIKQYNPVAQLVAATKTRNLEEIMTAIGTGKILAAGENRVQELLEKFDNSIKWDFIGQLQTNKVKFIVDKVELIHSVDRINLAKVIEKEAAKINKVQDILIEINSGKEESKGGIYLENTMNFLDELSYFSHIRVRGIMAVAPIHYSNDMLKKTFDEVFTVYQKLKNKDFCYLSMGMSNDYVEALKSGANLIRLGRAIFGERVING